MKSPISIQRIGFWLLISAPLWIPIGLRIRQTHLPSPTSKIIVDPITGKYDKFLATWIDTVIVDRGGEVTLNLDDVADSSPVINENALMLLSASIKFCPNAEFFLVTWHTGKGWVNILKYNRGSGEFFHIEQPNYWPDDNRKMDLYVRGVNDNMIHSAARRYAPYQSLQNPLYKFGF